MRLRWLGTAAFEMKNGDVSILIDPYLTRNPKAEPRQDLEPGDLAEAAAVFVTHGHFDHAFDVPAVVEASGASVHASSAVCASLERNGVSRGRLVYMEVGKGVEHGSFHVTAVPACHVSFDARLVLTTIPRCLPALPRLARLSTRRYPAGEVMGWLIDVEGIKLLHLGSACMRWGAPEEIDVFMVPVQGRTDICKVAAGLVKRVGPRRVIPHHYDDFYPPLSQYIDLEPFERELASRGIETEVSIPEINRWMDL